jgi:hypothetical protein
LKNLRLTVIALCSIPAFEDLVLFSILSPGLFRVLVPSELTAMLTRAIYLPNDITRNWFVHLPSDPMKAIAGFDAPASALLPTLQCEKRTACYSFCQNAESAIDIFI